MEAIFYNGVLFLNCNSTEVHKVVCVEGSADMDGYYNFKHTMYDSFRSCVESLTDCQFSDKVWGNMRTTYLG